MDCILLAGYTPPKDKEDITAKIRARERAEGETYLWGQDKSLLLLEDLAHNVSRLIDTPLKALAGSKGISNYVVVGSNSLGEYLAERGLEGKFVEQGAGMAENIRLGFSALGSERALLLSADLPLLNSSSLDLMLATMEPGLPKSPPYALISFLDRNTIYHYPRNFLRCYDDLFSEPSRIREIKEGGYLFLAPNIDLNEVEMLGNFYEIRKLLEPKNRVKLIRLVWENLGAAYIGRALTQGWQLVKQNQRRLPSLLPRLSVINEGLARLLDLPESSLVLFENQFPELSVDLDSEQDAARLGLTIVREGLIEYKLQVAANPMQLDAFLEQFGPKGRVVELFSSAKGCKGAFSVQSYHHPAHYFIVSRWESPEAFYELRHKHGQKWDAHGKLLSKFTRESKELGFYGAGRKALVH